MKEQHRRFVTPEYTFFEIPDNKRSVFVGKYVIQLKTKK